MQKRVKNRVAKRAERRLKREEGTIAEAVRSVNERHNILEGKSPYAKRESRADVSQAAFRVVQGATDES